MNSALKDRLARQQARLESLLALLTQEFRLLKEGVPDGERMADIAAGKQTLLAELAGDGPIPGLADAVGPHAEAATLEPAWQRVRELGEAVARHNERNGLLIGLRLQHTQRILNLLREQARPQARLADLYGPDGQAREAGGQLDSRA